MKIVVDIYKKTISLENLSKYGKFLEICFRENESLPVYFNNLKFGLVISNSKEKIIDESFPKYETVYESTDQDIFYEISLESLAFDTNYSMKFWVNNNEEYFEIKENFVLAKYEKPYQSWIWQESSESWIAPKPYPGDGLYIWNDEKVNWEKQDSL